MEKTILLIGKEMPEANNFITGLKSSNKTSIVVGADSFVWNKSSPISARSLILQSIIKSQNLLDVVFYFDENYLAKKFIKSDIQTCSQINDEYILSYQYLAIELLQFLKNHSGKVAFIYNQMPKPSFSSCIFIKSAANAFISFAESVSSIINSTLDSQCILVKQDNSIEEYQNDTNLAKWIALYLDSLQNSKNSKKTVTWIKPGSKATSVFSLFH